MFNILPKLTRRDLLTKKILTHDAGVYLYILFPIAVAFLITFSGARVISHFWPWFYVEFVDGLHIHHFAYGVILLAASGYLALISNGPRAKYLVALLHGFALGLAFDEFGFWLRLTDNDAARWSYDGVIVIIALFIVMISAESGLHIWERHFVKKEPEIDPLLPSKSGLFEAPPQA